MTEQVHEDSPFSTVFQQLLDLNEDFIEAVVERQSKENLRKSVKYHELLHQNLMELATFVDKMTISDDKSMAVPSRKGLIETALKSHDKSKRMHQYELQFKENQEKIAQEEIAILNAEPKGLQNQRPKKKPRLPMTPQLNPTYLTMPKLTPCGAAAAVRAVVARGPVRPKTEKPKPRQKYTYWTEEEIARFEIAFEETKDRSLFDVCDPDGGDCFGLGDSKRCTGTCNINALGILFTVFGFALSLAVPVVIFIYNRRHKFCLSNSKSPELVMNESQSLSVEKSQEELEIKQQEDQHHSPFFDLKVFDTAPFGTVGGNDRYTLAIETASKRYFTALIYWTAAFFILCVLCCLFRIESKHIEFAVSKEICSQELPSLLESCSVIKDNPTRLSVNFTVKSSRLVASSSWLSFAAQLPNLESTGVVQIGYNYTLDVFADGNPVVESFQSQFQKLMECSSNGGCENSIHPLVYVSTRRAGITYSYSHAKSYHLVLEREVNNNTDSVFVINFAFNPMDQILEVLLIILSVVEGIILMAWIYIMMHQPGGWKGLIPARKWMSLLLLTNNPCVSIIVMNGFTLGAWEQRTLREIWVSISTLTFIIYLLLSLDAQRQPQFSVKFYLSKILCVGVLGLAHILVRVFDPTYYVILFDTFVNVLLCFVIALIAARVNHVLGQQHYAVSRPEQLSFRVIFILAYVVMGVFILTGLTTPTTDHVSDFMPTLTNFYWVAKLLIIHATTIVLALIHLPPKHTTAQIGFASYTIRAERQFRAPSPRRERRRPSKANWDLVRFSLRRDASKYWRPQSLFCLELCCRLFNFSRLAYLDQDDLNQFEFTFAKSKMDWQLIRIIKDSSSDTTALIFKGPHSLIVSFRGTVTTVNIKTDLAIQLVPCILSCSSHQLESTQVHSGFLDAYKTVGGEIVTVLQELMIEMGGSDQVQVYCTGHSLGGALATLAALDLTLQLDTTVVMYNFGSPRVGNHKFADFYNSQVPKSFRIVNDGDVVVGGPKHGGSIVPGQRYKHIGIYVLLDGRGFGDIVLHPNMVERALMAKLKRVPKRHSMHSYKKRLGRSVALALDLTRTTGENFHSRLSHSNTIRSKFIKSRWAWSNWDDVRHRLEKTQV